MNEYELTYIRRVGLDDAQVKKVESKMTKSFEKHGGEVMDTQDLGEKMLAYPIEKEGKGHYVQFNFVGSGQLVDEIEQQFRITPEVLRFLTIRLSRNADPGQKKKEYEERRALKEAPPPAAETSESNVSEVTS